VLNVLQARGEEAVEGGRDAVTEGYRLCPDGSVPCTCGAYGPSHGTYRRHEEQDVQLSYRGGKRTRVLRVALHAGPTLSHSHSALLIPLP
jgi:hypothetical protein